MIPVATLYHWDLPQPLQDIGGWQNPDLVNYFVNYSRIAIQLFDGVGYWITINEPKQICRRGYGDGSFAPGLALDGVGEYMCAYVVAKCHAAVYHMFKDEFPNSKAQMSITIDGEWSEPASDSAADIEAAERRNQFEFGLYANPIFNGDWPQVIKDRVDYRSKMANESKSRLPEFTQEEINYINGTFDFMGFNTYWTFLVSDIPEPDFSQVGYLNDIRTNTSTDPSWSLGSNGNTIVPWGARKFLKWVKDTYNNPDIFITENGVSDDGSSLEDDDRIDFYTGYLNAILDAMYEDEVSIFGYTAWSLLDNFEWNDGYSAHFGLYHVDFTDPNRTRTPKKSVSFLSDVIRSRTIPELSTTPSPEPDTTTPASNSISSLTDHAILIISFGCMLRIISVLIAC
ncbi:hypothetical protein NQ317_018953 [Molorchus minor]|uniref:beta-glucosidase n=1 Tax=Molorchus minor TaxID=1323400 RepID=A0ABQ9J506_9CUCU|nr:hypothetical protein NQ317_018953 [Molorchus minor]